MRAQVRGDMRAAGLVYLLLALLLGGLSRLQRRIRRHPLVMGLLQAGPGRGQADNEVLQVARSRSACSSVPSAAAACGLRVPGGRPVRPSSRAAEASRIASAAVRRRSSSRPRRPGRRRRPARRARRSGRPLPALRPRRCGQPHLAEPVAPPRRSRHRSLVSRHR